ncbi:MAG: hypothetical protein ACN4EP_12240, partial [Sediminibacterium sp.]
TGKICALTGKGRRFSNIFGQRCYGSDVLTREIFYSGTQFENVVGERRGALSCLPLAFSY